MANDLPGNPHFAEHLLGSPDERSVPAMLAALAYEVRTANLFNFMQWVRAQADIDGSTELHNKIVHRLGLLDAPAGEKP